MNTPTSSPNSENVEVDVKIEQPSLNQNQNPDQSSLSLRKKLDAWSPVQRQPTIVKVHNELKNVRSEAYEPNIIAIGPYHSHKENLKKMEIHKLAYLHSFLDRQKKSIEDCVSVIKSLEPKARNCYDEPISLKSEEFIDMLILDGCFIIEFALRYDNPSLREQYDRIFRENWVIYRVKRDLLLIENQVPFFILSELFDDENLVFILLKIYEDISPLQVKPRHIESPADIKHLLELFHRCLVLEYEDKSSEDTAMNMNEEEINFIRSATSLAEYNVEFERANEGDSMFQIDFENGCMRLPRLRVEDGSESLFRNLIAYETHFQGTRDHMIDYAAVMDSLINTPEDVKLLTDRRIIDNWLGSEKDVADMFNKLFENVMLHTDSFLYNRQFKKVNEHCSRPWNEWKAKLKHNHFNSPWAIISIIAAFVLLVLTFVQTVFAVIK